MLKTAPLDSCHHSKDDPDSKSAENSNYLYTICFFYIDCQSARLLCKHKRVLFASPHPRNA
jgi:hypothetical protein